MIQYLLLFSRQGKLRLQKWFAAYSVRYYYFLIFVQSCFYLFKINPITLFFKKGVNKSCFTKVCPIIPLKPLD